MAALTGRFTRSDRLRDSRDFRRVSRTGQRHAGRSFVMLTAPPGPGCAAGSRRVGVSASRRVGNAVVRNRIKRSVREWFRTRRDALPGDLDIVVIARRSASSLHGAEIARSLDALAARFAGRDAARVGSAGGSSERPRR